MKSIDEAIEMSKSGETTPDAFIEPIERSVLECYENRFKNGLKMRTPKALPSSNSSCYEWSSVRGGINGFLYAIGCAAESGFSDHSIINDIVEKKRWKLGELVQYTNDSLGAFLKESSMVILAPETGPTTDNIHMAYRATGVLLLRRYNEINNIGPRMKMEVIRSPGMKARIIGVPDALTYIEGDWIRRSTRLLAPGHWIVSNGPGSVPRELRSRRDGVFVSVDLSKATDGLHQDVIEKIVNSLHKAGAIRNSDLPMALRGLGVKPLTTWRHGDKVWRARRGSPMGTPLSFIILSWVNYLATSAFTSRKHHGDDAVGVAVSQEEILGYSGIVSAFGASLNREKTFISRSAWTMCEVASWPNDRKMRRTEVFIPPSCFPPGLKAPLPCEQRTSNKYKNRSERIIKTLFPWIIKDPRLHLPVEIGGLGYTGRGLKVAKSVRSKLGYLISKGSSFELCKSLNAQPPFKEGGLWPKSFTLTPKKPKEYWKSRREVEKEQFLSGSSDGVRVSYEDLTSYKAEITEMYYRMSVGDQYKKTRTVVRPGKTKAKPLFKLKKIPYCKPLTVRFGVESLRRFAKRCKALTVSVLPDIASEILR
jgi:hypothetical protein